MKKLIITAISTLFLIDASYSQTQKKTTTPAPKPVQKPAVAPTLPATNGLKNGVDSISYAIGLNIAGNLKQQGISVNADMLAKAIEQTLAGQATYMSNEAANVYIQSYFQNQYMIKAEAAKKVGDKFLAENKTKAGVITLPSGMQYQVMKEGTGAKPTKDDKVKVHYHGTLIDGKVFDSSVERGQPAEFGVTQVIQGWVEALQLMPVGSKWKLFIPSDLAYGPQGPPSIGPNQVLIFEVELLEIVK